MKIKIIGAEGFDHIKSKCKAENRKITEIISRCIEQGIYIDNEIISKVIEEYKKEGIQAVPVLAINKRRYISVK